MFRIYEGVSTICFSLVILMGIALLVFFKRIGKGDFNFNVGLKVGITIGATLTAGLGGIVLGIALLLGLI